MKNICKNCLFLRITRDKDKVRSYYCLYDFIMLNDYKKIQKYTDLEDTCENFLVNKIESIQKLFDEYPEKWHNFGTDKRTAHYKDTKHIQKNGGDRYLPIVYKIKTAYSKILGQESFEFPYHRAIIHYENGDFKFGEFRVDIIEFPNFKKVEPKKELSNEEKKRLEAMNEQIRKNQEKWKRTCECGKEFIAQEEWKTLCYNCYIERQNPKKENCKSYSTVKTIKQSTKLSKEEIEDMLNDMIYKFQILKCYNCSIECEYNPDEQYKIMEESQ